ncbi:MAG: sensor domain-containing diguanylate cyclase [Anaerolineales bacterium]
MNLADLRNSLGEAGKDLEPNILDCLLRVMPNLLYVYDLNDMCYIFVGGDTTAVLGYTAEEVCSMGNSVTARLVHPEDVQRFAEHHLQCKQSNKGDFLEIEYRAKHVYGDWHWLSVRDTPLTSSSDGSIRTILGVAEDVSAHKAAEEKVWFVSTHDQLTGLYNRAYFEAEIERMENSRYFPLSILLADVDDLRTENEKNGHTSGDELLRRSAQVFHQAFRSEDVIARIGGNEFGLILPKTGDVSTDAILARVRIHINNNNQSNKKLPLNLSMGMATAGPGQSLREALKLAEKRLSEVKQAHKMIQ